MIGRDPHILCAESGFDVAAAPDAVRQQEENFRLSRIQAEGWAAARIYLRKGDPFDEEAIAALNPHKAVAERTRWFAGFNSAVDKL